MILLNSVSTLFYTCQKPTVVICRYVVIDTPGQIEVFTWSASGSIITEALASTFPTMVVYVMDTARSTNPVTFMSNMLYACSILYKTKLPFIVVLNKVSFSIKCCHHLEGSCLTVEIHHCYS